MGEERNAVWRDCKRTCKIAGKGIGSLEEKKRENAGELKRRIQDRLLLMMKKFHEVCQSEGITYYMNSGTMLGAIRHEGFIPWDDDVDLGLFRSEYERLCALPENVWGPDYELVTFHNRKEYPYCFAKLYDKNSTIVEKGYASCVGGIYLDIFPHDGAGNYLLTSKLRYYMNFARYWLLIYSLLGEKKSNPVKRLLKAWADTRPVRAWQHALEKSITQLDADKCEYVSNFIGRHRTREVFPKKFFGTPILYKFEDTQFYGPEMADEYLTWLYGDYHQLPPVEEQNLNHPAEFIDIELPYREYLKSKGKTKNFP